MNIKLLVQLALFSVLVLSVIAWLLAALGVIEMIAHPSYDAEETVCD